MALTRRVFLGAAAAAVVAACSDDGADEGETSTQPPATTAAPGPTTAAPPDRSAEFVVTGPTTSERVALTFHTDGDLAIAEELLEILAARDVVMTAFIVGEWLEANPSWARRLTEAGHELANHTYTHPTFAQLGPQQMTEEIVRCRDLLIELAGSGGRCFRLSGTADGTTTPPPIAIQLAGDAGYPIVLGFDVDPFDYEDPGADAVASATLDAVGAGSVISLHFDHPGTVDALPVILDGLEERGLTPVTASDLLGLP